jgi:hypothetical protein
MSYLSRLKALNSEQPPPLIPSKHTKLAFEAFEGDGTAGFQVIENLTASASKADAEPRKSVTAPAGECVGTAGQSSELPEAWVERLASLPREPAPRGVDPRAWTAMLDAAGIFLTEWGTTADALGWTADDLFSVDASTPISRRDKRGAAFFLADAEVVAITEDMIKNRNGGASQTIYRQWNGWLADRPT